MDSDRAPQANAPLLLADEDRVRLNRAWWDERVPTHVTDGFYDVDAFLAGRPTLRPFEMGEMGDVTGATLVHLQCHFGLDTLSWARRGAAVTGVDFSPNAIDAVRDLAGRAGLAAEFVEANVYDAVEALDRRTFDVVYTSIGAIIWLPDIVRWAATVAALLAPGGRFYMAEFHPFSVVLGDEDLTVVDAYFDEGPILSEEPGSYAAPGAKTLHDRSVTWNHGLGGVVTALAQAGLRIEFLHEHPFTLRARCAVRLTTYRKPAVMHDCCPGRVEVRTSPEDNKRVVAEFVERCQNAHDLAFADEAFHPDFVNHYRPEGLPIPGTDRPASGFQTFYGALLLGFPDATMEINEQLAERDLVATRKTFRGTHLGEIWGLPPSENRVELEFIDIFRVRDGKLIEHWTSMDLAALRRQMQAPS